MEPVAQSLNSWLAYFFDFIEIPYMMKMVYNFIDSFTAWRSRVKAAFPWSTGIGPQRPHAFLRSFI